MPPLTASYLCSGTDPASYGPLSTLDSVQVAPTGGDYSIQGLQEILPLRRWRWRENLIPSNKLRASFDRVTLDKKQRVLILFQQHSSIIFHLNCLLNLFNCDNTTHPGKIKAGEIYQLLIFSPKWKVNVPCLLLQPHSNLHSSSESLLEGSLSAASVCFLFSHMTTEMPYS